MKGTAPVVLFMEYRRLYSENVLVGPLKIWSIYDTTNMQGNF